MRHLLHFTNVSARWLRDQQIFDLIHERMAIDEMVEGWLDAQRSTDVTDELWTKLTECVCALKTYQKLSESAPAQWASFGEEFGARDLAPFITPLDRPDAMKAILFEEISASHSSSLDVDPEFRSLLAAHKTAVAESWLRLGDTDFAAAAIETNLPTGLSAEGKLAGSALGNFAAFFSEDWRRNDWSWGRIDASAGIIRALSSLPLGAGTVGPRDAELSANQTMSGEEDIAAVQRSVIRQQGGADSLRTGPGDLSRLRPAYLSALTHRAARVGLRAAVGGKSAIIKGAAFMIAPLFLSYGPFAFCHLAGIFCAAFLSVAVAAATPGADQNQQPEAFWISAALAVAVILIAISVSLGRVIKGFERRHTLGQMPSLAVDAEARLKRSARWSVMYSCAGSVSLIICIFIFIQEQESTWRTWIFVLATAWMFLAARRSAQTLPISSLSQGANWLWTGAAIIAIAGAASTAWLFPATIPPGTSPLLNSTVALGLATTVISAVLTHGWMIGARKRRTTTGTIAWLSLSILTGAATYGCLTLIGLTEVGATASVAPLDLLTTWIVTSHFIWWVGSWNRVASYDDANDSPWQPSD